MAVPLADITIVPFSSFSLLFHSPLIIFLDDSSPDYIVFHDAVYGIRIGVELAVVGEE